MTTFKEIRGTAIQVVSSDPSNPEVGQIWYNSSSGTLKGYQLATVNAWSSGGNVNTARGAFGTSGTQTAGLIFTGDQATPSYNTATESYNGTSWTTTPATVNTGRYWPGSGNSGTQTATLVFGGYASPGPTAASESYNGTSWTSAPNMNSARYGAGSAGTQTAALMFGGANPPATTTESYNGTSWTSVTGMNTSRGYLTGCGTQTAALGTGGYAPGASSATEKYNGSTWTSTGNLPAATYSLGSFGTSSAAIAFGGNPYRTGTASFDGSTWTANPTGLATGRFRSFGLGSQTAGLAISGKGPPTSYIANTEEWLGVALQTRTITVS